MDVVEYFQDFERARDERISPPFVALLTFAEAENYISTFRDHNVAFEDLSELNDTDLIIMGVDSYEARNNILKAIAQLPENAQFAKSSELLDFKPEDFTNIVNDNTKHFKRIYCSILSTKVLLKRNNPEDFLIYPPKTYATDLILKCIHEMEKLLDNTKKELLNLKKLSTPVPKRRTNCKTRKIIIGSLGSAVIAILSFSLFKSLQNIN